MFPLIHQLLEEFGAISSLIFKLKLCLFSKDFKDGYFNALNDATCI